VLGKVEAKRLLAECDFMAENERCFKPGHPCSKCELSSEYEKLTGIRIEEVLKSEEN